MPSDRRMFLGAGLGVTAALATHLIPVLARDARRLADAQRALTGAPPAPAARLGPRPMISAASFTGNRAAY